MTGLELPAAALATLGALLLIPIWLAVVKRIADRTAAWLLPEGQPWSFRVAWALVHLARLLAPSRQFRWHGWTSSGPNRSTSTLDWSGGDEVASHLDEDLRAARRMGAPVRVVLPFVVEAVGLRLSNAKHRFRYVMAVYPMMSVILVLAALGNSASHVGRALKRRNNVRP